MPEQHTTAMQRLKEARIHRPYTLTFAVILPIPGALGVIYGDAVSRALEIITAGLVSRIMGLALLVGALLTLAGILAGRSLLETAGLSIMAAGCAIYGLGVILGLGLAGAVAGSGFLAIATGTLLRVRGLAADARESTTGGDG
jgi:hypothetical protein